MAMVDGGHIVGRALANEGIEKAFVLCGGHVMPIFYGMRDAGIEIIDVRHECAAVYSAIAYTRASGKPAVVVTTAGPGVGNTPAGMMEALSLNVPVLQIGGAVSMAMRDAGDLQDMDTLLLMESCCKWAKKVSATERLPYYVSMAFRHALDGAPGPVYLEVPTDLVRRQVDDEKINFPENYKANVVSGGDDALIEEAADLLASAERPAVIVDDGARWSLGDDVGAIADLSDYLKMPVGVSGNLCRGIFGNEAENPLLRTNAMGGADVVLALGCRFDFRMGSGRGIPKDAKVIQVHTDMRQIGFNVRADIGILGSSGAVTKNILEKVTGKRNPKADDPWTGKVVPGGTTGKLPAEYTSTKTPTHPARAAGDVGQFLEEDASDWTIVSDGGEVSVWFGRTTTATRPGQMHSSGANGTIGTGPCLVVGSWVANRKPVLWYTGDGSFGFYAMEMETMARLGIPVVCVIANNSSWGMIHIEEKNLRAEEVEEKGPCNVQLAHMREYEAMAGMWGGYGEKVINHEDILPAVRRAAKEALKRNLPAIVNVEVDDESPSPFIAPYINMIKDSKAKAAS
ncbi:MAG: thiamine pyrophosphate-binding protein [Pseudomonadales bacterium]|jgi:acetolactate synthase-1/2/3 large subunit|nr:thiamine pyrophosphate-binding protein [Pseudomonadales bacterium]MDP7360038.1 thiamine pyrophosphate-binding protein [Pseudomonadales bacterium]MDP7598111.1 thiamine pyrophosphate-binding protein [Pseudomonadales bacterium]HJN49392.1 thiamine pyrophosphate-binding protein [Pseudomonadales bacterium]|tara:strand:+ start:208 stop:1917 length:1710 start_codon:yes stop_codon:yes gene_type:complete